MPRFLSDPVFAFHDKLIKHLMANPDQETGHRVLIDPHSSGLTMRTLDFSKRATLAVTGVSCKIQFGYDANGNAPTKTIPTNNVEQIAECLIEYFKSKEVNPNA